MSSSKHSKTIQDFNPKDSPEFQERSIVTTASVGITERQIAKLEKLVGNRAIYEKGDTLVECAVKQAQQDLIRTLKTKILGWDNGD